MLLGIVINAGVKFFSGVIILAWLYPILITKVTVDIVKKESRLIRLTLTADHVSWPSLSCVFAPKLIRFPTC